ncbi:hypothetical protein CWI36_0215p0010 [Hamiltosporidium magnivora]|uniref:RRM domain-containing protein n=1 Tax=Hamiltosporidium magnivora TaxID=148818 RepID=A0A4Q9LIC8_9MICR|nr:hypothetical protein CWI36_0215p0010 [Hamiltosporidium magnivora]
MKNYLLQFKERKYIFLPSYMDEEDIPETDFYDLPENINDIFKLRTLVFKNLPSTAKLQDILDFITHGDIENVEIDKMQNLGKVHFFDYTSLYRCYIDLSNQEVVIDNTTISIGIEQSSKLSLNIENIHNLGATRSVFLVLDEFLDETFFTEYCKEFGEVETIRIVKDKSIIYCDYFSFYSAIKFIENTTKDPLFTNKRFGFGWDRCFRQMSDTDEKSISLFNSNKTVYLGNIQNDISAEDILDSIKGGSIFCLKIHREKKCAFITFMSSLSAASFISLCNKSPLNIKGYRIKVNYGNNTPTPVPGILAVYNHATRVLKIEPIDDELTYTKVQQDCKDFGEIEKIQFGENSVKINFLFITDCYRAYTELKNKDFYDNYNLSFGNDRCGNTSALDVVLYLQENEFFEV